jgi:hypothetical protein
MAEVLAGLAQSPALYPMALDLARERLLFVDMDEADYRASSFLDERIVARERQGQWLRLGAVENALADRTSIRPLHFIFHAGHVGSTLLSRLLDETGDVLPLREPMPLRTIAEACDMGAPEQDGRLEMLLRLWERGFAATQCVVLKATSATERLAPKLLTARPAARAIVLNVSAESYLATALAAPNSATDLNAHGPERMHRLVKMGIAVPRPLTLGELAAMSWLAEKLTQMETLRLFGERAMPVDFDLMLQALEDTLSRVMDHFGLMQKPEQIARLARSPTLSRYSKAPEHSYSPALRADLLNEARVRYSDEIGAAMAWLAVQAVNDRRIAALL